MALSNARQYFRNIMNALDYSEHRTGFDFSNLPTTLVDKSYHISYGTMSTGLLNQKDLPIAVPITLRVFFKGYNEINDEIDEAADRAEVIVQKACGIDNRSNNTLEIKNIFFDGLSIDQRTDSNDNEIVVEMDFTVSYITCVD